VRARAAELARSIGRASLGVIPFGITSMRFRGSPAAPAPHASPLRQPGCGRRVGPWVVEHDLPARLTGSERKWFSICMCETTGIPPRAPPGVPARCPRGACACGATLRPRGAKASGGHWRGRRGSFGQAGAGGSAHPRLEPTQRGRRRRARRWQRPGRRRGRLAPVGARRSVHRRPRCRSRGVRSKYGAADGDDLGGSLRPSRSITMPSAVTAVVGCVPSTGCARRWNGSRLRSPKTSRRCISR